MGMGYGMMGTSPVGMIVAKLVGLVIASLVFSAIFWWTYLRMVPKGKR